MRWDVQLRLHLERHSGLQLQSVLRPLPVREHVRRVLHHLHQRRQGLLRDAASVLRVPPLLLRIGLLLLRLLRRHAVLLRHVLSRQLNEARRDPWKSGCFRGFFRACIRATQQAIPPGSVA